MFFAGTQDYYLRAFDSSTGSEQAERGLLTIVAIMYWRIGCFDTFLFSFTNGSRSDGSFQMNITAWFVVSGLGVCAVGVAQTPPASPPSPAMAYTVARGPTLALAIEAAQAAMDACKAKGALISVSVVDSAGILKLLLSSDGAFARAVTTSTAKAITAKDLNMPISELESKIQTDAVLAEKVKANPNYIVGRGAFPLRVGTEVIGAIGVGGGRGGNLDEDCARAGLDKISARLN